MRARGDMLESAVPARAGRQPPLHIRARLFAQQRVAVGTRETVLELPAGATIADAWSALVARWPVLADGGPYLRFARNGTYAEPGERLADGDEVACIPPVAGGAGSAEGPKGGPVAGGAGRTEGPQGGPVAGDAGESGTTEATEYRRIELTPDPIDDALVAELRRVVSTPADGAVVVFLGQTRETPGTPAPGEEAEAARHAGQRVGGLEYEAFDSMALGVLHRIADEIDERFGVGRLAIVHRTGRVALGEVSVAIVVAAPHRGEAFDACRYAIEELKARAPIWKAEQFADGSVWIGRPARIGAAPVRGANATEPAGAGAGGRDVGTPGRPTRPAEAGAGGHRGTQPRPTRPAGKHRS